MPRELLQTFLLLAITLFIGTQAAKADILTSQSLPPISLTESSHSSFLAAEPIANPTVLPTDVTPISRGAEGSFLSRQLHFSLMKKIPTRMWFNVSTELSQRYESNVFFLYSHHKGDYVYRTAPNMTVGYNLLPHTSVYTNYFVIKDEFAKHTLLSFPTTQSLSLGVRQDFTIGRRTSAQLDFQARELWQSSHLRQADFLPSLNLTYALKNNLFVFGSMVLQLRGRNYFVAPNREIDPFYTVGAAYTRGTWTFSAVDTFITNFRDPPFNSSIPRQGNVNMIADFEISHPVIRKMPGLVAFVRAEPVWNWSSHKQLGLSGFDIRIFGGVRLNVTKQSYLSSIQNLKKELLEQEQDQHKPQPKKQTSKELETSDPQKVSAAAPQL